MSKYIPQQVDQEEQSNRNDKVESKSTISLQENHFDIEVNRSIKKSGKNKCCKVFAISICVLAVLTFAFFGIMALPLYQYHDTVLQNVGAKWQFNQVTAVLLLTNQQQQAIISIQGLLDHSSFSKTIVATHKKLQNKNLNVYPGLEIVVDKRPQFDVFMLDNLIEKVETDYYLFATTQWMIGNGSFIDQSIKILDQFPDITQIIPNVDKNKTGDPYQQSGFSFLPGVHRKKDYQSSKGFSTIASGVINSKQVQQKISIFYLWQQKKALISTYNYNITKLTSKQSSTSQTPQVSKTPQKIQPVVDNSEVKKSMPQIGIPTATIKPNTPSQQQQPQAQVPTQPKPSNPKVRRGKTSQQSKPNPPQTAATGAPLQPQRSQPNILTFLSQAENNLRPAQLIFEINSLKKVNDLPMCLVVIPSPEHNLQELMNSISNQNYQNSVIVKIQQNPAVKVQVNYFYFKNLTQKQCKPNALTMFVNVPLQNGALKKLNDLMQHHRAYIAYSKTNQFTEVLAFYPRIYELLSLNDFRKSNLPYLNSNNREVQTLGLLQISSRYALQIDKQLIVEPKKATYFSIRKDTNSKATRSAYQKILRLSQDMDINNAAYQGSLNGASSLRAVPVMQLTSSNMMRAIDRQQLWYLPEGHSIQQLEFEDYSAKYKINELTDISKQVHFCVTVLSHNNIQNNRYIKVLKSIVQQKYDNYHIVFIDDSSTDSNMQGSIDYLKSIGFPRQRVTYVQNLKRNFATYNILNAAYNYCGMDDVQMLMDGDDEFIGKYAFQVINSYYQNPETWVVYSNYKTNFYGFGRSRQLYSEMDHAMNGRRSYISIFGAIRTWRTKVLYHIPAAHHKMANGQWLDTVYDDALSHPLAELSTVKRFLYAPQVLYQYNMRYGDNDDSTAQKIRHRAQVYRHVISLTLLKALTTLEGTQKDPQVQKQIAADIGTRYTVIP